MTVNQGDLNTVEGYIQEVIIEDTHEPWTASPAH